MQSSPSGRQILLAYVYDLFTQITHTAFVNANLSIDARLARWLLMYHDRLDGDILPVTHEFLSLMLGIRRAGVTVALAKMGRALLIETTRGAVTIIDRFELEAAAGDAYGRAERPGAVPSTARRVGVN